MYRVHKWFAVTAGGFLLVWLITGVVMLLPPISPGPNPVRPVPNVSPRDITLSPALAAQTLEKVLGRTIEVTHVNLRWIHDVFAYEIRLDKGSSHLVNAATGQVFKITPDLAERFVVNSYPSEGRVQKVEKVEKHSYAYQWGPLPVYRVVFDSDPSVDFFVSVNDGTVRRSDRWNRLRGGLERFHTFDPFKLILKSEGLRHGLMIVAGIIGIAAAATGYYLAVRTR